jgi:aspartyl-tRNA(Asn)/glutamyl-tRNA(Gln) amidotransferase subunit C
MKVSKEEIKHIANLANLNLTEQEIEKYTKDMENIIDFVEVLNSEDTEGIEKSKARLESYNVFRKDEVEKFENPELLLENAIEPEDGMFKIPKVL